MHRHRVVDFAVGLFACMFIAAAFVSCEETCYDGKHNNQEEDVDCGGPCVPCDTTGGTCFDGIQNQGEEGVDCGGPCPQCVTDSTVLNPDFICEGTGGSSYLPLATGNYWIYILPSQQWMLLEISGAVTQGNGEDYYHMVTSGAYTANDYFREEGGTIYKWNLALDIEEVYIPANPTAGFVWTTANTDSIVIDAVDATLSSQNGCTYESLLQITSHTGGNSSTSYYKQGLGLVELASASAYLDSTVVY